MFSLFKSNVFGALCALASVAHGAEATPWWEHAFEGDILPMQAVPAWEEVRCPVQAGMTIAAECRDGVLRLTHTGRGVNRYYQVAERETDPAWRGQSELGTTLELRLRVTAAVPDAPYALGVFLLGLQSGGRTYSLSLQAGRSELAFMGRNYPVNLAEFHTVRVTFDPVVKKAFMLYLDGAAAPAATVPIADDSLQPPADKRNTILFGATFSPSMQGSAEIDYIRWSNRGALAPSGSDRILPASGPSAGAGKAPAQTASTNAAAPGAAADPIAGRGRNLVDRWDRWPLIAVPSVAKAPEVDGRLDTNEWADASAFTGLIDYQTHQAAEKESIFYLCRTDDALFLGFRLKRDAGMPPRVTATGPVNNLWNADDGLEICVSRDRDFNVVFGLYGNGASGCSDGFAHGDSFDSTPRFGWIYRSRTTADGIEGELRIPADAFLEQLKTLGCPPRLLQAGAEWRLNVMRVDILPEKNQSDWSQMWGDNYAGNRLGQLAFPAREVAVRVEQIGALDAKHIGWKGSVRNGSAGPLRLKVEYEVRRAAEDLAEKRFDTMRTWDLIHRFRKEGPTIEGIPLADQISESGHLGALGAAYAPFENRTNYLEVAAGATQPLLIEAAAEPGQFLLALRITDQATGERFYEQVLPVNAPPRLELRLTKRFLMKGGIEVRARLAANSGIRPGNRLDFAIRRDGGNQAQADQSWTETVGNGSDRAGRFIDLAGLAAGDYRIEATARDETGKTLASASVPFRKPPLPDWWRNKIGITDKVLPPWTPVAATPEQAAVWGRAIRFSPNLPFPAQIVSQGRDLLAAPIALEVRAEGQPVPLAGTMRLVSAREDAAIYKSGMQGDGVSIQTELRVEFDGLLVFEMDVTSAKPLDRLVLSIPVRRDAVSHWGSSYLGTDLQTASYMLKAGRMAALTNSFPNGEMGFAGLFQLGDDRAALQWICEEDRGWENADRGRAMAVVEDDKAVTLQVRFIDKRAPLQGKRRYKWALMPTPVKPIDYQLNMDIVTMNGMPSGIPAQPWEPEKLENYFADCRKYGVSFVMYGGFGAPFHADVWVRDHNRKYIEQVTEMAHRHGVKILLYGLWGYDINGAENGDFGDEMVKRPLTPCFPQTYQYNPEGPMADFFMAGLQQTTRKYGIDGIYLDGFPVIGPLYDPLLDEGYQDAEGRAHGKWPIFALREWSRRMYAFMHLTERRDGIVYQHTSGSIPNMAILSFSDFVCGGEEAPSQELLKNCWPLDDYFVKAYQRPYGIAYHTLWYDWWNRPVKENQALAVTLLFGQFLNFYGGHLAPWAVNVSHYAKQPAPVMVLKDTFRNFRPADAEWWPYWKSAELVQVKPAQVKSSLYLHRGKKALVIVSNIEPQPAKATLAFDLNKMGFKSPVTVRDPILREPVPMANGIITLDILDERYRILLIEAQAGGAP